MQFISSHLMFTASKWIKGKEETQTDTELLLWLATNEKIIPPAEGPLLLICFPRKITGQ